MQRIRLREPVWGGLLVAVLGTLSIAQDDPAKPAPGSAPALAPAQPAGGGAADVPGVAGSKPSGPAVSPPGTDLAARYHFVERYTTEEQGAPGLVAQYRVGVREIVRFITEVPQGAPKRDEATSEAIYTDRPARVSSSGGALAVVRKYETFRSKPPFRSNPLEGLTVWFQPKDDGEPMILSLTDGRGLLEQEHFFIRHETFFPDLFSLLSILPVRIGDTWRITPGGARTLLGELTGRGDNLSATFHEVRQAAKSPNLEAVFLLKGKVGLTALNAQLVFSFPHPDPGASVPSTGNETAIEARGAITELRMAVSTSVNIGGPNSRFRRTTTRESILVRQLAKAGPLLALPATPPKADETNSWLTYVDPKERFRFRLPQNLQRAVEEPDMIEFADQKLGREDSVRFQLLPKMGDPVIDRNNRDPDFHLKSMKEQWRLDKLDVRLGHPGYLPEADWAGTNMRVYRIDSVVMPSGPNSKGRGRVYNDIYLVSFGRDEVLFVNSDTEQDPPVTFRKQVESMIRSFRFGSPNSAKLDTVAPPPPR